MADRDVKIDVIATDKTGPAFRSTQRNLKETQKSWNDYDGQVKKTAKAFEHIGNQWGRGFSRMGAAARRWAASGDGVGKRFAQGLFSGIDKLSKIGSAIGNGLSTAISAAGPYVQTALAVVLVGAAVAAAPALAAAIVGGAAGVGIVGGVMLAAQDSRVAGALKSLSNDIQQQLGEAAFPFVVQMRKAIREVRSQFAGVLPDIRRIFSATAPFLQPLIRSIGVATKFISEGVANAVEKAGPIIRAFGQGIEDVGKAVGYVFNSLSDNGATMGAVLKAVFNVVSGAIYVFGTALNVVVEAVEWIIKKIPGGKAALDSWKSSADTAKPGTNGLAEGFKKVANAASDSKTEIKSLKEVLDDWVGANISYRDAQIQAKEATAAAAKTLRENGAAHGFNTQKGRNNEKALNDLATAFNAETTAGDKSGVGAEAAAKKYEANRNKLIAMAEKAGYSKQKAQELAAQLLKTPKSVTTQIQADTYEATQKLETFQKKINGLHGKTVTVRVQSNGDHYIPGVGTQTKNSAGTASFIDGTAGTFRTGGATRVESTINQTLNVSLDGMPFYSYTARAINESERRQQYRAKVGRR